MSNDLLDNLAGEGALAARGEFQLDQSKAREKMEQFQLVNPYHYILELVQGAHLLGATEIHFTVDADELEMVFDGDPLTVEELDDIYSAAFSREPDDRVQARRHFAIALTAIGALGAAEIRLTMPHDLEAAQLISQHDDETVSSTTRWVPADRNRFYVKEKFRFGHILEFFDSVKDNHLETELIRERCQYASIPITVNGQRISQGHHLSNAAQHIVDVAWKGDRGLLGLHSENLQSGRGNSEVRLVQNGVWITSVSLDADLIGVEAVFETSRLTKNLSQSAFVEDDTFRHLMHDVLRNAMYESMAEWVKFVKVTSSNYGNLRTIATSVWRQVTKQKRASNSPAGQLAKAMERLPIWPNACMIEDGPDVFTFGAAQMVHLRSLTEGSPDSPMLWAERRYHTVTNERPIFLRRADTTAAFEVIRLYARRDWKKADDKLQALEDRERNRQRWMMRAWSEPGRALHPHKVTFSLRGFDVELFSATDRSQGVVLVHVHDGRVLNSGRIPEQIPAAMVVIKGSFSVNDTFEAPMRTADLEAVYRALLPRLPEVWLAVASDKGLAQQPKVQQQLGMCALQMVTGTYPNFALKAFGFGSDVSESALEMMRDSKTPAIVQIGARSNDKSDKSTLALERLEALGSLANARIVRTSAGDRTLREVVENASDGTIWTADLQVLPRHNQALRSWERGPIVDESYPWGYLADALYGSTTDAIFHLKRDTARRHFMARDTRDYWKLLEHPRYAVEKTVSGTGWSARWGARGAGSERGVVRCIYEDRALLTQDNTIKIGTIDVTVRGDRVKPNENYDGLHDQSWYSDMIAAVATSYAEAIRDLAERAHNADSEGLSPPEYDLLWQTMAVAYVADTKLARIAFARDTTGRGFTAHDLVALSKRGSIHWVREGQGVLQDIVPPGAPVIELPNLNAYKHLANLVGDRSKLTDVTESEAASRLVEQARDSFYQRAPRLMRVPYAIVTKTEQNEESTLVAGLLAGTPDSPVTSNLVICREQRVVDRSEVSTPFARFEFVYNDDEIQLDARWEKPVEDLYHVRQLAKNVGERVIVDYLQQSGGTPTNATRDRVISWARVGLKDEDNTSETWPTAWHRLLKFPLFVMPGFGRVSIAQLRDRAEAGPVTYITPRESSRDVPRGYVIATGNALLLLGDLFGDDLFHAKARNTVHETPRPEVPANPQILDGETSEAVAVWEIGPEASLQDMSPSRTPEEILIEGLRDLIRTTSVAANGVLESKYTEEMNLWGNDPKRAARVTSDRVSVMTDHVLTTYALEDLEDPVRRTFLASALLTVINHHYEEVDENDETSLQEQLLADMIGRGGART